TRRAAEPGKNGLGQVHALETRRTLLAADPTHREPLEFPEVRQDAASRETDPEVEDLLQVAKGRLPEFAPAFELVQRSVAHPCRDQRNDRRAAVERELHGPAGPVHAL